MDATFGVNLAAGASVRSSNGLRRGALLDGKKETYWTTGGGDTTATIDYGVVVSGQATLELDDGAKIVLNAGDAYIQNGTRHRWSNSGDVPAVIAVSLIAANHTKVG